MNKQTLSEKEWQIENDAYTLIEAERIKADKKRLSSAEKKAKQLAKELSDRAKNDVKIASKFNKVSKKGK